MSGSDITPADLAQFTGTEHWYRHPLNRGVSYTDGVRFLAEKGRAYWLLDLILLSQLDAKRLNLPDMQFWKMTVHADRSATVECADGEGMAVYTKRIDWTDFPLAEVELWFANDVLYLPSEH